MHPLKKIEFTLCATGFNPLTGRCCNGKSPRIHPKMLCFNPLTGRGYNVQRAVLRIRLKVSIPLQGGGATGNGFQESLGCGVSIPSQGNGATDERQIGQFGDGLFQSPYREELQLNKSKPSPQGKDAIIY